MLFHLLLRLPHPLMLLRIELILETVLIYVDSAKPIYKE